MVSRRSIFPVATDGANTAGALEAGIVAGIVHDLGNLIQVASSAVSLIARNPELASNESEQMLARARASLDHAGALVRRNLRLISNRGIGEVPESSVRACLANVAMLVEAMGESGLILELEVGPDLPGVRCDPIGLQNAVLNLVFNARDAMSGRGRVFVAARAAADEAGVSRVEIGVTDHGVGMTRSTIARAFAPFFTTKTEGLGGVGLPMVERFVEHSGGEIAIDSEPGVGTTVFLRLPTSAASVPPATPNVPLEETRS